MKIFFLLGLLAPAGLVAQTTPFPPTPAATGPSQEMVSPDTIQFPNNPVSD